MPPEARCQADRGINAGGSAKTLDTYVTILLDKNNVTSAPDVLMEVCAVEVIIAVRLLNKAIIVAVKLGSSLYEFICVIPKPRFVLGVLIS